MLSTQDLLEWFEVQATGLSPGVSFSMDTLPDAEPHRACAIEFPSGGLGLELEDALDKPTFQLLTRGVNGRDAERIAFALDALWIDAPSAFYIADTKIIGKGRFGAPPSRVGEDQNELHPGRILRAAIYWCRVERNGSGGG